MLAFHEVCNYRSDKFSFSLYHTFLVCQTNNFISIVTNIRCIFCFLIPPWYLSVYQMFYSAFTCSNLCFTLASPFQYLLFLFLDILSPSFLFYPFCVFYWAVTYHVYIYMLVSVILRQIKLNCLLLQMLLSTDDLYKFKTFYQIHIHAEFADVLCLIL